MVTTQTSLSCRSPALFGLLVSFSTWCGDSTGIGWLGDGFIRWRVLLCPSWMAGSQCPGCTAPVTVIRDAHGIPTIEAVNLDDLFFAQGYVTAQDRLFQMDGMRRFAAGELAEVVGSKYIEHDRQQRILGMRLAAQKTMEIITAEDRARFRSLCARRQRVYRIPSRPAADWSFAFFATRRSLDSEDSALIGAYMVEDLSTSPRHALTREKILAKLGPELTADLYVNSSWRDRPPTVSKPTLEEEIKGSGRQITTKMMTTTMIDDDDSGSDSSVTS